jgi:hypothetical protein
MEDNREFFAKLAESVADAGYIFCNGDFERGYVQAAKNAAAKIRASLQHATPTVEGPCLNCGRPLGKHSFNSSDVCNFFIGGNDDVSRTVRAGEVDTRGTGQSSMVLGDAAGKKDLRRTPPAGDVRAREAFEAWAASDSRAIQPLEFEERTDDNDHYYESDHDNSAFAGWKAALMMRDVQ